MSPLSNPCSSACPSSNSRSQSGRNNLCPRDSQPPPRANLKDYANILATPGAVRCSNCIAIAASGTEQFTKHPQRENPGAENMDFRARSVEKWKTSCEQ